MTLSPVRPSTSVRRPASPAQRGLVLAASLRPEDPSTNWAVLSRLPDGTEPERFAEAVESVLSSYDAFADRFEIGPGGEVDAVLERRPHRCPVTRHPDVRSLRAHTAGLADTPFDLAAPPLCHTEVAVVGGAVYFAVAGAHVLSDGFGFFNITTDIAARYDDPDFVSEHRLSPADEQEPYRVPRDRVARHVREVFAGVRDLRVEGWHHRDARGRIPGSVTRHDLGRDLYDRAGRKAGELGVSRYTLLLTAYSLAASVVAGQDTVVVSTPMSNRRSGPESAASRGVRVNALPVRADVPAGRTVAELAGSLHAQVEAWKEYEQYSFADLAREIGADGGLGSVQPSLGFSLYPRPLAMMVGGVEGSPVTVDRRYLQHSIGMFVEVGTDAVTLLVERCDALADVDVAGLYLRVLRQLLDLPADAPVGELSWVDDESSSTVAAVRRYAPATLTGLVDEAARDRPDRTAVLAPDATLTCAGLAEASRTVAEWLLDPDGGVPAGTRLVGLRAAPSARWLATALGVLRAGMAYVPMDVDWPVGRCVRIVAEFPDLPVLTLDGAALDAVPGTRTIVVPSNPVPSTDVELPAVDPQDTAYVVFTSGTTGDPKGVPTTHDSAARFLRALTDRLDAPGRRWSLLHSPAFDISVAESLGAIVGGGTVVIPDPGTRRDPAALGRWVREYGVQVVSQTPSAFALNGAALTSAPSLETVLFCGERLDAAAVAPAVASRPDVDLVNCYGITETTVHHTTHVLPTTTAELPRVSVVGRPLDDTTMTVVDRARRVVPRGVVGEFAVAGPGLMAGYLGDPELTAARIHVIDGVRHYLSGDHGYLDAAGDFVVLGRRDHQVKVRGHRCELGDVTAAVRRTGLVSGVHVAVRGEGISARLAVAVVPAQGVPGDALADSLRSALHGGLPAAFVPDTVLVLDALPVNANGKTDSAQVAVLLDRAERAAESSPPASRGAGGGPDVAAVVRECWAEALGNDDFGDHDTFFDAGGSSALVIPLAQRLADRLGLDDLDVVDLFDHPTPHALVGFLTREVAAR